MKSSGKYTCTIHSEIAIDEYGYCPECGIALIPKDTMAGRAEEADSWKSTRREFLARTTLAGLGLTISSFLPGIPEAGVENEEDTTVVTGTEVSFTLNENKCTLNVDPRTSLLDTLREHFQFTGTKKGCDHGQCGACTVLVNGRRINSCLMLTAMCHGSAITTIEGLSDENLLHPMQKAFISHDAFQCGYCTPGQICSAVGLLNEGHATTEADVRELMSGNICRCGAYQNITEAILEVIHS